jgi:hypothetical protein
MQLVNITYAGQGSTYQNYNDKDESLILSNIINASFGDSVDYIEYHITDQFGSFLDVNYNAKDYYPDFINNAQVGTFSSINIDPQKDVYSRGFTRGKVNVQYNFLKNLFNSSVTSRYWIKEISTSRTEIKLSSQDISDSQIEDGFNAYQAYASSKNYFNDFYLNFGLNKLVIAINVAYTEDDNGSYLVIKLYEPLPTDFDVKDTLWIVDRLADSVSFNIDTQVQADVVSNEFALRGPNYRVSVNKSVGQTTPYYTYGGLFSSNMSSSAQQLQSYYDDNAVSINVDYTDFSNFIHFSSAVERINNFTYKLGLIESYNAQIAEQRSLTGAGSYTTASITTLQNNIDGITKKFDPYEYYLYYASESFAWPKRSSTKPYTLYSITSSQASDWLGSVNTAPTSTTTSILFSASFYDSTNKDSLEGSIPQYLLEDPSNQSYVTFIHMIGQHFDNIWLYYKDVTNRFNATNDPNTGISIDLVSDALKSLGQRLYTNTSVSDNLYYSLFGYNEDGSLLPPTGSENINTYVTSSLDTISANDLQKEIYKRVYHNLPYLLKSKGTERGLKALIACYGIPDSILTVREFGGQDRNALDGIYDIDNNQKVISISSSLELSSSLLSPYSTIQYYNSNNRLNTSNIEVAFSPSDKINNEITGTLGTFNLDQYIGNPADQSSGSYIALDTLKKSYFSNYTYSYKASEYIRLIKYFNNSLFKMIKDYVPARSNTSTGIVIKSHLLERNKYARHEPSMSIDQTSQSIDMLTYSANSGGSVSGSTMFSGSITGSLGIVNFVSDDGMENFNGEFGGSNIAVASMTSISNQTEVSKNTSGSIYLSVNYGALYQNVTSSVRSTKYLDLDYSYNQNVPVNFGIITQSISQSQVDNTLTYKNPNNPYAQLQDYNYAAQSYTIPRYYGSKTISSGYTVYTIGDASYGLTAAIDKEKRYFSYLVDIYSSSAFLPGRSNAQIKYLINDNEDVLDLTKANNNIFEVQNVFKSGEHVDIGLFKYDERNPYSQLLVNNPTLEIYEGGFRYLPILHNVSGSATSLRFSLQKPVQISIAAGSGASSGDSVLQTSNWSIEWDVTEVTTAEPGTSNYYIYAKATYNSAANVPYNVSVNIDYVQPGSGVCGSTVNQTTIALSSGTNGTRSSLLYTFTDTSTGNGNGSGTAYHWPPGYETTCYLLTTGITATGGGGGGSTGSISYSTIYTTEVTSSQPCVYAITASNQIAIKGSLAQYYNSSPQLISVSDPDWTTSNLERVVTPFSLSKGDMITLFDYSSSLGWNENFEYRINEVNILGEGTSSVILASVYPNLNSSLLSPTSSVEIISGSIYADSKVCRYIIFKHVPDETNVILRYDPKDSTIVEEGVLYPQYLYSDIKKNAGNIIKSLAAQNLVQLNSTSV